MRIVLWLLAMLSGFVPICCFAQQTQDDLAVAKYPELWLPSLLVKIKTKGEDTSKINNLVKLSSIYNRKKLRDDSNVDSALLYARLALNLSRSLHYNQGFIDATFLICKNAIQKSDLQEATAALKMVTGEQRVRLLIVIAEHYVFLPGALPQNLDRALPYIREAQALSTAIHSVYWHVQTQNLFAKYYYRRGLFNQGRKQYRDIIAYYQKAGDQKAEAHWWSELGLYMPDNDSTYREQLTSLEHAKAIYHRLHMLKDEASVLMEIAEVNKLHNNLDIAINLVLQAVRLLKSIGVSELYSKYDELAEMYQGKGDLGKALSYALLSYRNSLKFNTSPGWYAKAIGNIYRQMGEAENSITYYKLGLNDISFPNIGHRYMVVRYIAEAYIALHRQREAFDFTRQYIDRDKPVNLKDKQIIAATLGECYQALNAFKMAEKYYLEMISLDTMIQNERLKEIFYEFKSIDGPEAFYLISKFYISQQKYTVAAAYLKKARTFSVIPILLQKDLASVQGKIDSASGNYRAALVQFQQATAIKDSLFTVARDKDLQALRLQFESSEKEKDLVLLHKDLQLQTEVIAKANQARKFTYTGILLLLILLGVIFNRYRIKQKSNVLLEEQKHLISLKNDALTQLVTEKEWLIKEVHHRVKNNLQIVMTLLSGPMNDQNEAIDNGPMQESIRRVQAMSMLHQRLYLEENSANVAMRPYLHELIDNLAESFGSSPRILFKPGFDDIELDMVQAVPIGLIFNEAITNALKYAFSDQTEGTVEVALSQISVNRIRAVIQDDGNGLPADFELQKLSSFGLKLIRGLADEIDGELVIRSNQGTSISLEFEKIVIQRA